jgi:hypothetical protein
MAEESLVGDRGDQRRHPLQALAVVSHAIQRPSHAQQANTSRFLTLGCSRWIVSLSIDAVWTAASVLSPLSIAQIHLHPDRHKSLSSHGKLPKRVDMNIGACQPDLDGSASCCAGVDVVLHQTRTKNAHQSWSQTCFSYCQPVSSSSVLVFIATESIHHQCSCHLNDANRIEMMVIQLSPLSSHCSMS